MMIMICTYNINESFWLRETSLFLSLKKNESTRLQLNGLIKVIINLKKKKMGLISQQNLNEMSGYISELCGLAKCLD